MDDGNCAYCLTGYLFEHAPGCSRMNNAEPWCPAALTTTKEGGEGKQREGGLRMWAEYKNMRGRGGWGA